jgi:hypothetical protein
MANFKTYGTGHLIDLQHRLNAIFCKMRDKGQNIECIYRNLRRVEQQICWRRAYW